MIEQQDTMVNDMTTATAQPATEKQIEYAKKLAETTPITGQLFTAKLNHETVPALFEQMEAHLLKMQMSVVDKYTGLGKAKMSFLIDRMKESPRGWLFKLAPHWRESFVQKWEAQGACFASYLDRREKNLRLAVDCIDLD